jgi:hypothetical protein
MGKTIIRLVFIFAIAAAVACDDDNGTPTTPTTVTQTGAFAPQPVPPSTFPSSPASPSSLPAAPNGPSAPNHPPAPNHPIFGDVNAVTGVCPAIRLTVGGRVVVTERSTIFVIACRSIRTKTRVRISGRFTPAGTMIASVVEPTAR